LLEKCGYTWAFRILGKGDAAFAGGDRGAKIWKGSEIFIRRNEPKHFEKYYKMAVGFFYPIHDGP
jgi:hypothetical protein